MSCPNECLKSGRPPAMAHIRKTTSKTVKTPVGLYPHDLLYDQLGKDMTTNAMMINKNNVSLDIVFSILFMLFYYLNFVLLPASYLNRSRLFQDESGTPEAL